MGKLLRAFAVFPLVMLLSSCDLDSVAAFGKVTEEFQVSYELKPGSRLGISTFNGSVDVVGWEKGEIQVSGTKYASNDEDLKALKVEVARDEGWVRIKALRPSGNRWGNMGVKLTVRVPFETQLENIESSNASLRVEDLKGRGTLRTSNGSVRLYRVSGPLEVRTSNGRVEGDDLDGVVQITTSNGSVQVQRFRGVITATTSNGSINVEAQQLDPGQPVKLTSSNGRIEFAAAAMKDNDVRIRTSNSSITVRLPANVDARLDASTSQGRIENEFDVSGSSGDSKKRLEGQIGRGGSLIQLGTSNGSIRIARQNSARASD
jgi:hypothetical protein